MKSKHYYHFSFIATLLSLLVILFLGACSDTTPKYVIGVSQCSEDSWRSKLHEELDMATYFNEGVTLRYASADDDKTLQERQINEMISEGIDLLIVSPQQMGELSSAVDRAYDKGIPVILFDRKTGSDKYTAFMGADNYLIGSTVADYIAEKLGGKGCIVEIGGLKESSPAIDRTRGFRDQLKKYPDMKVVGYGNGNWKEDSGREVMEQILKTYDGPIDCVFGGNDRMSVGARKAIEAHRRRKGESGPLPLFIGIDALPGDGQGICQVRDGVLTASAIYPTHGDELMALALKILNGQPYERETAMASSIVTEANAKVLLLQYEEVVRQGNYLRTMHARVVKILHMVDSQRFIIFAFIFLFAFGFVGGAYIVRAYRQKHRLNRELGEKNIILARQRDELQVQRDQLQEQRDILQEQHDQLCYQRDQMELQRDELALQHDQLQKLSKHVPLHAVNEEDGDKNPEEDRGFYARFMQIIERNISNSEFSVEHLSEAVGLSRAQLYRRCKQLTGNSPVEILRSLRMQRAGQLLSSTDHNVSEVTYACGFTSPSYFTKCFKEHYGMSPTDFVRFHQSRK